MARLQHLKKAGTIVGTFAVALSIGFVMQYGDAHASRFSDGDSLGQRTILPVQVDTSPLARATALTPKVPAPVQLTANPLDTVRRDEETIKLSALVSEMARGAIDEATVQAMQQGADGCAIELLLMPDAQAMMQLAISSLCRAEMPFEAMHHDLIISGVTDMYGRADIRMPALSADASVAIAFEDGGVAMSSTTVPDADAFNRIVLQWKDIPADFLRKEIPETFGTLNQFGSPTSADSHFAEVFTFPASRPVSEGLNALTVQAEISDQTCGQLLEAQTFLVEPDIDSALKDIRITLPGCEHVGTFLELKKVLGGQTLLQ